MEDAEKLSRGDSSLIAELLDVGLWDRDNGGITYHDHHHWNSQDLPKSTSARMVYDLVPDEYPSIVKQQLANQVSKLLDEGQHTGVIADAVRLWLTKQGAGPSLLPFLVSDVLRATQGPAIHTLVETATRTGDLSELEKLGYQFIPPDPERGESLADIRARTNKAKKQFLKKLMEDKK